MAEDLLEKGAILQRDKEIYAMAPHIPRGIIWEFNLCAGWPARRKNKASRQ